MKYGIQFLGDTFWGIDPEVPQMVMNQLILEYPYTDFSFNVNNTAENTFSNVYKHKIREIIGKKDNCLVICLGWNQILQEKIDEEELLSYQKFLEELKSMQSIKLFAFNIPESLFEDGSSLHFNCRKVNRFLNEIQADLDLPIFDASTEFQSFLDAQNERGGMFRSLHSGDMRLTHLGKFCLTNLILKTLSGNIIFKQYKGQ